MPWYSFNLFFLLPLFVFYSDFALAELFPSCLAPLPCRYLPFPSKAISLLSSLLPIETHANERKSLLSWRREQLVPPESAGALAEAGINGGDRAGEHPQKLPVASAVGTGLASTHRSCQWQEQPCKQGHVPLFVPLISPQCLEVFLTAT